MNKLHPKQEMIINIIKHSSEPLSLRDIQLLIGVSSPSVVVHHLQQLQKKGLLKRNPHNPQDYQVLDVQQEKPYIYLPVYSTAQCGKHGLLANTEPIEKLPIPIKWIDFSLDKAFLIKARGSSMEPRIKPGDYAICKAIGDKYAYKNYSGKIIVGIHEEEPVIKKIFYDEKKDKVVLQSLNPDFPPFIASSHFWIEGEVRGIFSYS